MNVRPTETTTTTTTTNKKETTKTGDAIPVPVVVTEAASLRSKAEKATETTKTGDAIPVPVVVETEATSPLRSKSEIQEKSSLHSELLALNGESPHQLLLQLNIFYGKSQLKHQFVMGRKIPQAQ